MKCKQIQPLLERYLRGELSQTVRETVEAHAADCVECREALAFHESLSARLGGSPEVPIGLRARVEDILVNPVQSRSWLSRIFGDPTMKKILFSSTAIAAALIGALVLVPGRAQGATAKEKFVSMRSALAKAAREGELTVSAVVSKGGMSSFSVLLDGSPLPPDVPVAVSSTDDGKFIDYTVSIDLSEANFSSIQFGKDHNTLNLVPKGKPGNLDVVRLDPKSSKPIEWSTFAVKLGAVQPQSTTHFAPVKPGPSATTETKSKDANSAKPSDVITLHMRVGKGDGTATITIKKN